MFCVFNLSAQKDRNVKLKIEGGFLWGVVEERGYRSGRFLCVEPKLKTSDKTIIGLRIGGAVNYQKIRTTDPFYYLFDNNLGASNVNTVLSFVATYDYYSNKNSKFNPYFGLGFGYYFLDTSRDVFVLGIPFDEIETNVNNKLGILIRGGLNLYKVKLLDADLSNFTLGIEFNLIPKTDIELTDGPVIGTILNSNVALAIGYTFGSVKI